MAPERFIAIDWSGNATTSGQKKHIFTATFDPSGITLQDGLTRDGVCDWLIEQVGPSPIPTVIGLDFAFSFPVSFQKYKSYKSADELWDLAGREGEVWLRRCPPPFWGRPGKKCPPTHKIEGLRSTDSDAALSVNGTSPKSPYQIGGAGAVGTGSIRGFPILKRLRQNGFSIWPFHPPAYPLVVEIYPRLLTGKVKKSQPAARRDYLRKPPFADFSAKIRDNVESSEDAFDALVSAVRMSQHASSFANLTQATDPIEQIEGRIWAPPTPARA
jgi:hypothetical protein